MRRLRWAVLAAVLPALAPALAPPLASAPASAAPRVIDAGGQAVEIRDASRVVSVGGALTEIVYALGQQDRLVGVDTTSLYPPAARGLPQVGYQRTLATEGLLSLAPTLLLATEDAGPPNVIEQAAAAGVTVLRLPGKAAADLVPVRIRAVGAALGAEAAAEKLAREVETDLAGLQEALARSKTRPRVLFLFGTSSGATTVAGLNTAADAMIRLAGGVNAITGYAGYKPLSPESAIAARPDVILTTPEAVAQAGGMAALAALPAFAATPAGQARRIVVRDTLALLGFGPRAAKVAQGVAAELHPDLGIAAPAAGR